jgi:hypothetical protein
VGEPSKLPSRPLASGLKPNFVQNFGYQLFVPAVGIYVGGIPEIDPELNGFFKGGDRFNVVGLSVTMVHAHTTQAYGR